LVLFPLAKVPTIVTVDVVEFLLGPTR
jgi:hypothetical protein